MSLLDIDLKKFKPPYLIHSDLFKTFGLIRDNFKKAKDSPDLERLHLIVLSDYLGFENLIFPSFNYSFSKDKVFDVQRTPSEVGALSNFLLERQLMLRTKTPIFSFITNISSVLEYHGSPFSEGSVLDLLYKSDGSIIFYGADISSCTYLHYLEDQYGPPTYRYEKEFNGLVLDKGACRQSIVRFHVRPLGLDLDYNWGRLFDLLLLKKAIQRSESSVFAVRCRDLSSIWGDVYVDDQFSLLSGSTRKKVEGLVKALGRGFVITDFEGKE